MFEYGPFRACGPNLFAWRAPVPGFLLQNCPKGRHGYWRPRDQAGHRAFDFPCLRWPSSGGSVPLGLYSDGRAHQHV
jgi:hypothetical protein